ncbi:unnamed protein product [Symbiodinium sp. CCMP2592]|nr:unnamed protein product [Symbiodinium sp. CCMP2592]
MMAIDVQTPFASPRKGKRDMRAELAAWQAAQRSQQRQVPRIPLQLSPPGPVQAARLDRSPGARLTPRSPKKEAPRAAFSPVRVPQRPPGWSQVSPQPGRGTPHGSSDAEASVLEDCLQAYEEFASLRVPPNSPNKSLTPAVAAAFRAMERDQAQTREVPAAQCMRRVLEAALEQIGEQEQCH